MRFWTLPFGSVFLSLIGYLKDKSMKIVKEKFKFEPKFNFYWGRIYFISDNKEKKTKILWAATHEYLRKQFLTEAPSGKEIDSFVNKVVQNWKRAGRSVFKRDLEYDIYAVFPGEKEVALSWLKENRKA